MFNFIRFKLFYAALISFPLLLSFGFSFNSLARPNQTSTVYSVCEKYLGSDGARLESWNQNWRTIQSFLQILHQTMMPMDVNQWPSDNIRPLRFINLPRAHAIAEQLNDPNAPLSRELSAHIAELNGGDAQSLWDKYFTAYDKIVGFTQGFWDIATAANNILPRAGKIADFGAGTGNISTLLGISTPDRDIYALDFSPRGLEIAREKFLRIPNSNPKHFHIQFFDLTKSDYPANEYDGAVMSNVLYNFEKQQKLEILKNIFKSLKPGAPFVLNDPIECSPEQLTQFLESTVYDSMRAGAHVNEYEFAFLAKINISVLFTKHFLSLSELRSLASEAGFEVLGDRESYYGVARFLYLRKPPVAAQ